MSTQTATTTLKTRWAFYLAGRGLAVFPLVPGTKRPAGHDDKHCPATGQCAAGHLPWQKRATTDPTTIRAIWADLPEANIGIACGPSNRLVIDCDTLKPGEQPPVGPGRTGKVDSGRHVLLGLARRHDTFVEPTFTVRTPSGGWHLYYAQPAGATLRNTAGYLGWKIDTRGHGGYVVGPGSVLPNGRYDLVDDRDSVTLSGWLHQAVTVRPIPATTAPHQTVGVRITRYATAALLAETTNVAQAPPGQRNAILSRAAYALGQLIGAGALDETTARTELEQAWASWTPPGSASKDLGPGGVIDTAITAGKANPRRITERQRST